MKNNDLKVKMMLRDLFPIKTKNSIKFIAYNSIVFVYSLHKTTVLVSEDDEHVKIKQTLQEVLSKLAHKGFIKVHRSYIVNTKHIKKIVKNEYGGYDIEFKNIKSKARISKKFYTLLSK